MISLVALCFYSTFALFFCVFVTLCQLLNGYFFRERRLLRRGAPFIKMEQGCHRVPAELKRCFYGCHAVAKVKVCTLGPFCRQATLPNKSDELEILVKTHALSTLARVILQP